MPSYKVGFICLLYLSICTHLSHSTLCTLPSRPPQCLLIPITQLHQMQTGAPARSHATIQVNIINSSFDGAQCERYGPSPCHPSGPPSPRQQQAVPHRWASALPCNELRLCAVHIVYVFLTHTRWRWWQCVIYSGGDTDESSGDKLVWFRLPVRQTEVVLLSARVNHLHGHQRITRIILMLFQVVMVSSLSPLSQHREMRLCFYFSSEETAWCYFLLLLPRLLHFLSWIIYHRTFAFVQTSLLFLISLWPNWLFSYQRLHIGPNVILGSLTESEKAENILVTMYST